MVRSSVRDHFDSSFLPFCHVPEQEAKKLIKRRKKLVSKGLLLYIEIEINVCFILLASARSCQSLIDRLSIIFKVKYILINSVLALIFFFSISSLISASK